MVFPSEHWSTGNHTYLQRTDGFILTLAAQPPNIDHRMSLRSYTRSIRNTVV